MFWKKKTKRNYIDFYFYPCEKYDCKFRTAWMHIKDLISGELTNTLLIRKFPSYFSWSATIAWCTSCKYFKLMDHYQKEEEKNENRKNDTLDKNPN
jgi:uncharacterized protein CbrC (UPF0167 family)